MKLSSTLLSALGVSSDRTSPQPGDQELTVPPTILPVISLRALTSHYPVNGTVGSAATPTRTSFLITKTDLQAASAGLQQIDVAFVAKGFWAFWASLTQKADYTSVPALTPDAQLVAINPDNNNSARLMALWSTSNTGVVYWADIILISESHWQFQLIQNATAAAQTFVTNLVLSGSRFNA